MFVATDKELGARVISLDPAWVSRFWDLRAWVTSGRLVCPGCKQKLLFRAGDVRRPHFAHRAHSECPQDKQSAEVLEAKAQLYGWLITKYPGQIDMDMDLHIPDWDGSADLVVRADEAKAFAYWIFDHSPRNREGLLNRMPSGVNRQVIFTESARKTLGNSVLLTKAQRELISATRFDESKWRGHLHFFDTKTRMLTLYRGLYCIHEPSSYCWGKVHEAELVDYRICAASGEIIAADDFEHEEVLPTRLSRSMSVAESGAVEDRGRPVLDNEAQPVAPAKDPSRFSFGSMREDFRREVDVSWLSRALKCELCGEETTEYSSSKPGEGTCVCRACLPQHLAARLKGQSSG